MTDNVATGNQTEPIVKFARKDALDQLTAQAEEQCEYDTVPSPDYAVKDYNLLERMHKQEGTTLDQEDHFKAGWEACYGYYHINELKNCLLTWKKYYDGAVERSNENAEMYQKALTNSENNAEVYKAVHSQLQDANDLLQQAKHCFDLMKMPLVAEPIQNYFDKYKEPQ